MRKHLITSFIILLAKLTMALPNDVINTPQQLDIIIPSYISDLGNGFTFELKLSSGYA